MRIGVGIDTGGTYTDAVIYDPVNRKVLNAAKAPTTRDDLAIGIANVLAALDPALLEQAEMISLSTTLATNASIENKGGRAKLLFIGVDPDIVGRVGAGYGFSDTGDIYFLEVKTGADGEKSPDWAEFLTGSRQWLRDAEALGIVQIYAMENGAAFEKQARELVLRQDKIPVICGHELFFSDLNAVKRGAGVLLNGRLIPVLAEFLTAVKKVLKARQIKAPVSIVHSDGGLMSEEFSGARPVETVLSGPAASAVGAAALTNKDNAVVVDMGGTTTDLALLRNGLPVKAKDGINIGSWKTFVKGLYVETLGLGGDSAIRYDQNNCLLLDTRRVIPLSAAAERWPEITVKLRELLETWEKHSRYLYEFFTLVKDIEGLSFYTDEEKQFCRALKNGPLIYTEAAAALGKDVYNFNVDRLENAGIVMRCGLTPTDIMHLQGDFRKYSVEAAELAGRFAANSLGLKLPELCDLVYDRIKSKLYFHIIKFLLKDRLPEFPKACSGEEFKALINYSWKMAQSEEKGTLELCFKTPFVLIGAGAPVHIFLPDVAEALGTTCIIPEYAGVANALGAAAGNIKADCTIVVEPQSEGYIVYGVSQTYLFPELEEAIAAARREAEREARAKALRRGAAGNISVTIEENPVFVQAGYSPEYFLESKIVATAIGKIGL